MNNKNDHINDSLRYLLISSGLAYDFTYYEVSTPVWPKLTYSYDYLKMLEELQNAIYGSFAIPPNILSSQTYSYPDGTKRVVKPVDGEVCTAQDYLTGDTTSFVWDGQLELWYEISHRTGTNSPRGYREQKNSQSTSTFNEPKCECGAEKVGSNNHSSWCEKNGMGF
jgi:hypothetical protein